MSGATVTSSNHEQADITKERINTAVILVMRIFITNPGVVSGLNSYTEHSNGRTNLTAYLNTTHRAC